MWVYKHKQIKSHKNLHPDCTDFVYVITYTNGKKYIGKKTVKSVRKRPPLKGKKRCRRVLVNLPFLDYKGSSTLTKNLKIQSKEILYQCSTKKAATYIEAALLFETNAIFKSDYLNKNISGKFFDNDLDGVIE